MRYHWLRDALNDELFELEKIHTDHNGSDMLTRNLPRSKFEFCRSIVGMTSSSSKSNRGRFDGLISLEA